MTEQSKIIKESFRQMADLYGIPPGYEWQTRLAKKSGIPLSDIHNWIKRNKIREERLNEICEQTFPKEKWYKEPTAYEETPEFMGIRTGQDQFTDVEYEMIRAMRELDVIGRRGIYFSVMEELNEALREKRIKKDSRRKAILEKAIGVLKKAI